MRRNFYFATIVATLSLCLEDVNAEAETSAQAVSKIRVETRASTSYVAYLLETVENAGKWNIATPGTSTGCSSGQDITYIVIANSNPGKKDILSVILTAKVTGSKLVFIGYDNKTLCSGNDFFEAEYVILQ